MNWQFLYPAPRCPLVLPCAVFLALFGALSGLPAQSPSKPLLIFRGQPIAVSQSLTVPPGHYTGEHRTLVIGGDKAAPCVVEITPGCVMEDVKFHLREGGELTVSKALLRRCHIFTEPNAVATLESTGLDHCEFSGSGDSRRGYGSLKVSNSVVADSALLKPANYIGLDLQDSLVVDQKTPQLGFRVAATSQVPFVALARKPQIRQTTFTNCTLQSDLLVTASHCTFNQCTLTASPPAAATATAGDAAVVLPNRWLAGTPAEVSNVRPGVRIQVMTEAPAGGCTLEHRWDGKTLTMTEAEPAAQAVQLRSLLPGVVIASAPASATGTMPGAESSAAPVLKLQQTSVNGLLVMPLASGKAAGKVSKLTLTAVSGSGYVRFAQQVGDQMDIALREVEKLIRLRHKALPLSHELEIGFEEKYSDKDGPSAAVACALLMESAITGQKWDPAFAVTGDLNSDGSVQPIGGVGAKIRGATNGACKIVGIPAKNENAAADILVRDGPGPLVNITVFALNTFDEATALAAAERKGPLQEALTEMDVVCSVLKRDPRQMISVLRTQQAVARLQSIVSKAPNCLSAKYLLLYAQGKGPTVLTLAGSIEAADADAMALAGAINYDFSGATRSLQPDELGGSISKLRNLRPMLDQRVWPYADALVDFGEVVRSVLLNPIRTGAKATEFQQRARQAAARAVSAKEKLLADPLVREELGV